MTDDATRIVSGSSDNTLRLWDATSGTTLRTLSGHTDTVRCCAMTADATRIVSGSDDGTVRVWGNTPQIEGASRPLAPRRGAQTAEAVEHLRRSGERDAPPPWGAGDAEDISEQAVLPVGSTVYAVGITPDGKRILSGSADHTLRVWRIPSGKWTKADLQPEHTIDCGSPIYGISVAGRDFLKIVVALSNGTCLVLEIEQGK